jgi:uracil-DNA glycosylase family 4
VSTRRDDYLARMGIPVWVSRSAPGPAAVPPPGRAADDTAHAAASGSPERVAALDWEALRETVRRCTRCELHRTRRQTVFGVGRPDAELLVIGEAPGQEEDRRGEPFVGRGGQLLTAMLKAIGLRREDIYIANILKCRPPNNRDPKPREAAQCTPYLERQIELIGPKVLLALGRISAQWLLQSELPVGRLRGTIWRYSAEQIPLVVSYHPAYLLRTPAAKAKAWQDLCEVKTLLESGL